FAYAIPPLGDLLVVEGTTTINTVTFKTGVPVLPVITGTQLPVPTFEPGSAPTEVHLVCFPHGEALGPTTLEGLVGFKRSAPFLTEYRRDFGPFAGSSPIWKVKRATPGLWDCSVVVRKHFGGAPAGGDSTPQKEYTLVVGRALKVAVDSAKATTQIDDPQSPPDPITGARRKINVQPLPITVNTEETAKLAVNIKAARFFDANAMGEIQGDKFDKMFNFIPKCVAARAKDGALLGIGVAVPIFTAGTPDLFGKMEDAIHTGDTSSLNTHMSSVTMRCSIEGLPAGEGLVMATALLYPTVVKAVTFTSNTTTALDVDFEAEVGTQIGAIQGTVTDKATGTGISNVTVKTQHRAIPEKKAITGSDGSYAFIGLPFGRYGIHVDVAGYEVASNVAIIKTTATTTVSFALRAAPGSVTGTVLKSRFPFRQGLPEQKCLCWNETLNTQTDNPPAIQTSHTDELGTYTFKRLVASDKYRVVCIAEGKGVMNQTITATSGAQTAADMVVQFKPPELRVNHRIDPITGKLELLLHSPKPVASLPTARYTTGTSFNTSASATSVTLTSAPVPNTWTASIDKPSEAITLRVTATDGFKTSDTDHSIGAAAKASNVVKHAEEKAIEGSSFYPDESEKDSACTFPAGVVTFSSSTTPTVTLTRASSSTVTATLPSGASYASQDSLVTVKAESLELASGKKLLVSLPCDPKLGNPQSFQLFQLIAGTWTKVEATLSYSPTDKNCEGEIKSISNAALAASLDTPTGNVKLAKQLGLSAVQNGEFVYTGAQTTASGTFSILSSAQSGSTQGSAYTGASLNAYNFPNPFNMTTKTLSLTSGGSTSSLSTSGTIIRYDLPSANGGRVLVRIYTLAGELVRVIDEGDKTGGFTYYTTWDGKNKDGENVASGVYFAVFDVPGQKPKDHTIKMAVLK
ncbi:MAG: carboxypeptidase regulatory-like domain-containing protein, partial [Elusimicrobia bacterium]|nr:carboxypeptidase regulatory-like domain-containing protein [Elusimicrobiota bacterium]